MNTQTTYETGATSHAINDLILFADNTRELAEVRDKVYHTFKRLEAIPQEADFYTLFKLARKQYRKEFPTSHKHLYNLSEEQESEFCRLYAGDFNNWKQENK